MAGASAAKSNDSNSQAERAAAARQEAQREAEARARQAALERQRQQEEARQRTLSQQAIRLLHAASQGKDSENRAQPNGNHLPTLEITDGSKSQSKSQSSQSANGDRSAPDLSAAVVTATMTKLREAIDGKPSTKPAQPVYDGRFGTALSETAATTIAGRGNEEQVAHLLSVLTQAQKQQVEQAYDSHYHTSVMGDVARHFSQLDNLKIQDVLQKADSGPNYAGDLAVMIDQTHQNGNSANGAIMRYMATMSSSQIKEMEAQYQSQYGKSFSDAMSHDAALGKNLQTVLPELMKGADKRSAADNVSMVRAVAQYGVDLVAAALGGNSPASTQARSEIMKDKGLLGQLQGQYSGEQLSEVNDFVHRGQISLTTIIQADHKNPNDLARALQTATPEERQRFLTGEALATSGQKPKDAAAQQALDYYDQVHGALEKAGNKDEVRQWQEMLSGDHISQPFLQAISQDHSAGNIVFALQHMSKQDAQKYKDDPAYRKQVAAAIFGLSGAGEVYAQHMLEETERTGKPPMLTAMDKVLSDIADKADKATALTDLQRALQENPTLMKEFSKKNGFEPAALHLTEEQQALFVYAQKTMGADQAQQFFSSGKIGLAE